MKQVWAVMKEIVTSCLKAQVRFLWWCLLVVFFVGFLWLRFCRGVLGLGLFCWGWCVLWCFCGGGLWLVVFFVNAA